MFNPVYDPYAVMNECDGWTAEQKDTAWEQIVSDLRSWKYDKPEIWLHDVACSLFSESGTKKEDDPRIKTANLYMSKLRAQYARETPPAVMAMAELTGWYTFWNLHRLFRKL